MPAVRDVIPPPPRPSLYAAAPVISAVPEQQDLKLYEGDDFHLDVDVSDPLGAPADLTGAVAAAQIRLTTDDETILAAFTCTITDSTISLHLPSADAVDLPTSAVWDLQITDSGIVTTLLYGKVTVQPEVTRP